MTIPPPQRCVVVGYDGSPAARAAVALAVDRVGAGRLYIVHAYHPPADFWGTEHQQDILDRALAHGERLLGELEASVEPRLRAVDFETELLNGPPADAIARVAEARHADEIIIGTRGYGRVRAVLGSVAHELLHLAPCPVTVLPERVAAAMTAGESADDYGTMPRTPADAGVDTPP
jgi:nucleotide-binding universal stress UspA family protein